MNSFFKVTFFLIVINISVSVALTKTLVWTDEFNYTGLPDSTKWGYDTGGSGWGNNELQYYTDKRSENARVEDGNLIIETRKEEYNNKQYTSARLVTRTRGDWLYGRIEVSAKLPKGRGLWPAIWMLPTDCAYGSWPNSGEADIMENVGYEPNTIHCTVHTQAYNHLLGTQKSGSTDIADPFETYHLYAIEWFEDHMDFFVDNDTVFTFQNELTGSKTWPFDKKLHLILNIAVGGDWGGVQGVDDAIFPQRMAVDYVRVYSLPNGPGPYSLSVKAIGNGSIKITPEQTSYDSGTVVTIISEPGDGYAFSGFTGNLLSTSDTTIITMIRNISATAVFVPIGEMVKNGDFSIGNQYWLPVGGYEGGAAQGSVVNGEYNIEVTSAGTQDWSIQLNQEGIKLEQGKSYTLTFDASAALPRRISSALNMAITPFTTYAKDTFDLSTQKSGYSLTFKMNSPTDPNSRVEFDLGLSTATVFLDNVSLRCNDPAGTKRSFLQIGKSNSLSLFFNSQIGQLFVKRSDLSRKVQLRIFNIRGEALIAPVDFKNTSAAAVFNMDDLHLVPGTYIVRCSSGKQIVSGKILIN
jgi:beta-glucanase (GH16 family)